MEHDLRQPQYLQETLERRILHGLSCEWDTALWVLPHPLAQKMKKPVFAISDMKHRWGYWSRKNREIVLSRRLVMNHSWRAVREVLRHEMAHQFTDEVLGALKEPPHGTTFQEACRHLRADPGVSGNYRFLDDAVPSSKETPEDRMMVRIQKLMSLAQSRNQHEAEAAMAKAHELVGKYNIDLVRLDRKRNFVSVFLGKAMLRRFREEHQLALLLQKFYFVYCIWVSSYVFEKGKMGRVLEISGTEKNVQIAAYVYDFVNRFIEDRWRDYNRDLELNRYRKTDFALGVLKGFAQKLERQSHRFHSKRGHDLIKAGDPLLNEYVAYHYPYKRSGRGKPLRQSLKVKKDGEKVGDSLVIHKGISRKGKNEGHLLK